MINCFPPFFNGFMEVKSCQVKHSLNIVNVPTNVLGNFKDCNFNSNRRWCYMLQYFECSNAHTQMYQGSEKLESNLVVLKFKKYTPVNTH